MSPEIKMMLTEAYELADAAQAAYEREIKTDPKHDRSSPTRQYVADASLVYKECALDPVSQQQAAATMDETTQRAWDQWIDGRIAKYLGDFADIVGEETARNEKILFDVFVRVTAEQVFTLRDQMRGEISKLKEEIAEMRRSR